jgi:ribosome-binding protein aMBF1 (putative translation factor)
MKRSKATSALEILNRRHPPSAEDIQLRTKFRQEAGIAEVIHAARTEAGLSQRALAKRVGTTASVICRLEDGDYNGHSMSMLRRVADALGRRVEVRLVPASGHELRA